MLIGKIIRKRYKIIRLLGEGGMGSVAEAFDTLLDSPCAVKEIGALALQTAGGVDNFKREAVTLQSLKHERIVGYRDFEQEKGTMYLITELVQGTSLSGKRFPETTAISIVLQILEGLGYAHSKGVLHRDVKPANIMLTPTGDVVIVDFGIAKSGGVAGHTMYQAKGAYTPCYASPEQAGNGTTVPESDLYSVGVVLYELLTGNAKNVFPDNPAIRYKQDTVRLVGLSVEMQAVIAKATAVNSLLRYSNAVEFAEALRALKPGTHYTPPSQPPTTGPKTAVTPTKDPTSIFDFRRK